MADLITSGALFWCGAGGIQANNNPIIYTPTIWALGSSIGHLSDFYYPPGSLNDLMTPSIGHGISIHTISPMIIGMMEDMGWGENPVTGIEDELSIISVKVMGEDEYGFPIPVESEILYQDEWFLFNADFNDEEPYGDYIDLANWKIELFSNIRTLITNLS